MTQRATQIRAQLEESCRVKQSFSDDLVGRIAEFAEKAAAAIGRGRKLVLFGNGAVPPMRSTLPQSSWGACAANAPACRPSP